MSVKSPEGSRRADDRPIYSQADFDRMRLEILAENRISILAGEVGTLSQLVGRIPADMEAIARRVFGEQWEQLRKETSDAGARAAASRWRAVDTFLVAGQLALAVAVVVVGIFK